MTRLVTGLTVQGLWDVLGRHQTDERLPEQVRPVLERRAVAAVDDDEEWLA